MILDILYEIGIGVGEVSLLGSFWITLKYGGFALIYWLSLWIIWWGVKMHAVVDWGSKRERLVLAIDIPLVEEQSMQAVENIIIALHSVQTMFSTYETLWQGQGTDSFSLEIVSIEGYIQYFIWCDRKNVDLVKGSIFAQYPDAEIHEVEDYTKEIPDEYPNDEYQVWGAQFKLAEPDVNPIKTYEQFQANAESEFADPLASLLELMSRFQEGEQLWLQYVITAFDGGMIEAGKKEIDKLIGRKSAIKRHWFVNILNIPLHVGDLVFKAFGSHEHIGGPTSLTIGENTSGDFLTLTTGEKGSVEAIQKKVAKLHFGVNMRFMYIARSDVKPHLARAFGTIIGTLDQFAAIDSNSFKVDSRMIIPKEMWILKDWRTTWRRNSFVKAYKKRSNWAGVPRMKLSTTEIATLFHFPLQKSLVPTVSTASAKKSDAPSQLPSEAPSPFEKFRQPKVEEAAFELQSVREAEEEFADQKDEETPQRRRVAPPPPVPNTNAATTTKRPPAPPSRPAAAPTPKQQPASTSSSDAAPPSNLPFA